MWASVDPAHARRPRGQKANRAPATENLSGVQDGLLGQGEEDVNRHPVTAVTALFNVERETKGDGRRWDDYLAWFNRTLELNVPMIVFIETSEVERVNWKRHDRPTEIVVTPRNEIPRIDKLLRITQVLESPAWKLRMRYPRSVENILPAYNAVIWSKFTWMRRAADGNPFGSDVFLWADAGLSRFFGRDFDTRKTWPHPSWSSPLTNGKIWIEGHPEAARVERGERSLDETLIGTSECLLPAGLWGGASDAIRALERAALTVLEKDLLSQGRMDNEQVCLALLWARKPAAFEVVLRECQNPQSTEEWLEIARRMSQPFTERS